MAGCRSARCAGERRGTGVPGRRGSQGVGREAVSPQPGCRPEISALADSQSARWVGPSDSVGRGVQAGGRGGGAQEEEGVCWPQWPPLRDEGSKGG